MLLDPICHTFVGAALARAGLDRWTTRATATLIIATNAPDVDIVAALLGRSLEWRRGLTHGVPALLIWPVVIALVMSLWDRSRRSPDGRRVSLPGLVGIATIGVWTHLFLDYLNNYGMRWLMPIRDQWFYGDSLFIVDPWLYLALGGGVWLHRRAARRNAPDPARPARIGVFAALAYVGAMIGGTALARTIAARAVGPELPLMATAVPANPFVRQLVVDLGDRYRTGSIRLLAGRVEWSEEVTKGSRLAGASDALRRTREGRAFLHWARLPAAVPAGPPGVVRVYDLRYSDGSAPSWASMDVTVAD